MIRAVLFAAALMGAAHAEPALDAASANARYRLSASPVLLIDGADVDTANAFMRLMAADEGGLGAQPWSDLAAGAVQIRREAGETGQTLWYNPVFDAAYYVAWRREADGWVAADAALILGETLRNAALSPAAGWAEWMRSALPAADLEATARATLAAAEAAPDWAALARGRDVQKTLALVRVDRAGLGLRRAQQSAISDMLFEVTRLGGADPAVQAALERAGVRAFQTLRPVGAWPGPEGLTVALQAPDAPALTIFALIPDDGGARRYAVAYALAPAAEPTP
ncbi:MAG: hypothetical protein NW203_01520 [Hyphomonadaceae bacterium]|nr:hypothetical protein [Hyphomonadaceae bacterium]